ncbi:hypothetical protein GCM10022223_20240 [Kineosporia mesophila]|uniref:Uncharacterized protein n=1 Tax=Kineosporia mesophila TaxID=566012 RepID=A0ABP6ZCT0_9ACTN
MTNHARITLGTNAFTVIRTVATAVPALAITYVDGSGQHTTSFESGVGTQLGQSPVEVTAMTIR